MTAHPTSSEPNNGRRDFLKKSALGAGFMVLPSYVAGVSSSATAPNSRLNVAIVGVGGKGRGPTIECMDQDVVALCDVDRRLVQEQRDHNTRNGEQFDEAILAHEAKGAKWFSDYREMFTELGDKIDAVIISIPDHMHFPVALSALNHGINVYCEKPLTHTVEEARVLAQVAKEKGLVTQMGNQGHSNAGTRLVREWIQAGVIGEVQEVHSWTNRPAVFWPQGVEEPDHSKFIPVVPEGLDWNLWQGVAPRRAYDPALMPFSWRAFIDYGCGALGDMACHIMDSAFWGLDLGSPASIEAATTAMNGFSYPVSSVVTYEFPARGKMPPVTYKWYDGDMRPNLPEFLSVGQEHLGQKNANGSLIIGEEAAILTDTYSARVSIVPKDQFDALKPQLPPKTIPRIKGSHLQEFFNAIREGRPASSDFSYAGPFTETILLGTVAQRLGRTLRFDGAQGQFKNDPEANELLKKDYPKGWIIG